MTRALWIACVLVAVSCAADLESRSQAIGELLSVAREQGAKRCAPVELAMAESHHDFAKQEIAEGHLYRARDELQISEENARTAIDKSPRERCVTKPPAKPPSKPVAVGPKDSDGDGIADPDDRCPREPEDFDGFEDEDGCADLDNDADGIADTIDRCPLEAEDRDRFEDDDGCPDCDNDGDGVLECPEAVDMCPDEAANTPNGCPDKYKLVVVTKSKLELRQAVYFDTAKATIKPLSFALLNEVAEALGDHPEIHVRIEGHTDSRGRDAFNLNLSNARATSVRDYLIERGVDSSRMVSQGYGETKPIADNRTKAGREQNRRVEFVITKR